jgi:hypothetical protein
VRLEVARGPKGPVVRRAFARGAGAAGEVSRGT